MKYKPKRPRLVCQGIILIVSLFLSGCATQTPRHVAFLIFKQEKCLQVWTKNEGAWKFVKQYPVLAASGGPGPKLRAGDRQVPEGIYRVIALNPHSEFYLSMELNYPNKFDREHAHKSRRHDLGDDIFIHGGAKSIGCIAVGNPAIRELYGLVARVGIQHITVIIAPDDLRYKKPPVEKHEPRWVPTLYVKIKKALQKFN